MKRTMIIGLCFVAVMLAGSASAMANLYSPDLATIQNMGFAWNGGGTTSSNLTDNTVGNTVTFAANLQSGDGTGTGWASMGIGYPWGNVPAGDLSAYTGYALTFENTNNSNWLVNLYMNTGWTDAPWSETDRFYQSGWVEIAPGESATLVLNFTTMTNELYIGGVYQGLAAVSNQNHVTNIGFQVGGNMTNPWVLPNPSNPDNFHITVSPVPVPGALLLGLFGLGFTGLKLRRFA